MAEYYAVLKKAVSGLESGSAEARRAVYDKARNALIGQLKAIDPPLAASEISRQRLELEEAIRRVERETAAEVQSNRYQRPPETEVAPSIAAEPPPPPPQPAPPPVQRQPQSSPQDIFRRAIQDAETRGGGPPPSPPVERAPPRTSYQGGSHGYGGPEARPAGNWPQARQPEYRPEPRHSGTEARLAPDYDSDWQQPRGAGGPPMPARGPGGPHVPADPYVDRRDVPRQAPRGRKPYLEEDEDGDVEQAARPSRLPTILLIALILAMIAGLGALGWSQRALLADLFGSGGGQQGTPPEVASPAGQPQGKADDRVPGNADDSVRVIGEPQSGGDNAPAPPQAGSDAIADAIGNAPTGGDGGVAQRAVLYEEPLDPAAAATGVTAINAVVTWRFVENGASGPEVEANLDVPERGLKIRLAIRRNTDSSLPASHLVETVVNTPAEFPGKGIRSVPRLVFKTSEDERGLPLIGAAAKVADGFFWIALSSAQADIDQNLKLLRDRSWIDLPVVYETGQRAILTFEKGTPGQRVFEQAFAAWNTG